MRRAKIVCTLGPAVESIEKITELIDAGMNMARLNLSHGGHDEHQKRLDLVRTAAKKANKAVAILVDLQGPKIRLGRFSSGMSYRAEIHSQLQLMILLGQKIELVQLTKDYQEIVKLETPS